MNHRSILIIDDNEQIRAFLRKMLETAGYMVTDAPNGQEGLRQFRQTPRSRDNGLAHALQGWSGGHHGLAS